MGETNEVKAKRTYTWSYQGVPLVELTRTGWLVSAFGGAGIGVAARVVYDDAPVLYGFVVAVWGFFVLSLLWMVAEEGREAANAQEPALAEGEEPADDVSSDELVEWLDNSTDMGAVELRHQTQLFGDESMANPVVVGIFTKFMQDARSVQVRLDNEYVADDKREKACAALVSEAQRVAMEAAAEIEMERKNRTIQANADLEEAVSRMLGCTMDPFID